MIKITTQSGFRLAVAVNCLLSLTLSPFLYAAAADLHWDGRALADNVTLWSLQTPGAKSRGYTTKIPRLSEALMRGTSLTSSTSNSHILLRAYILAQPYDSVEPHQLFEKASELEGGNYQRALMLIWDQLRENWRNHDNVKNRNFEPITLRLRDVTGERDKFTGNDHKIPHAVKTIRGDNFSAWYHFFGTALYAYSNAHSIGRRLGRALTEAAIYAEEHAVYKQFIDPQKRIAFDREGMRMGLRLSHNLRYQTEASFRAANPDPSRLYRYEDPKRYGNKWHLKPEQAPEHFGTDRKSEFRLTPLEKIAAIRSLAALEDEQSLRVLKEEGYGEFRAHAAEALSQRNDLAAQSYYRKLVDQEREEALAALRFVPESRIDLLLNTAAANFRAESSFRDALYSQAGKPVTPARMALWKKALVYGHPERLLENRFTRPRFVFQDEDAPASFEVERIAAVLLPTLIGEVPADISAYAKKVESSETDANPYHQVQAIGSRHSTLETLHDLGNACAGALATLLANSKAR